MKGALAGGRRYPLALIVGGALVVAMALLVALYGGATYVYFRGNVAESLRSTMSAAVESSSLAAENVVSQVDVCMNLLTDTRGQLFELLRAYSDDQYETYQVLQRLRIVLEANLSATIGNMIPRSTLLFVIDEGMPFARLPVATVPESVEDFAEMTPKVYIGGHAAFSGQSYYARALAAKGEPIWFSLGENRTMLFAAQQIRQTRLEYNRVRTDTLGVAVMGFDMSWMRDLFAGEDLMQDALVMVAGVDGAIVYASDQAHIGRSMEEVVALADGQAMNALPASGAQCRQAGVSSLIWRRALNESLTLYTLIPLARIDQVVNSSIRIVVVLGAAIIALGVILIYAVSQHVTRPIQRLSNHMRSRTLEAIALEGMVARAMGEIAALYDSFNEQNATIERLMRDARQAEREKRRKDIQFLQAQMNPHFLYNTLDCVCCMALVEGNDLIAEVLSELAEILRYNLKDPDDMVPLSDELHMIARYLRIQNVRLEAPLPMTCDVEAAALTCLIPKLVVQPLVENAVSHVAGRQPAIAIRARVQGDALRIAVWSNSPDADARRINAHLAGRLNLTSRSTGLGIRNIDQRLVMLFGGTHRLHYAAVNGGLEARLEIPVARREDAP